LLELRATVLLEVAFLLREFRAVDFLADFFGAEVLAAASTLSRGRMRTDMAKRKTNTIPRTRAGLLIFLNPFKTAECPEETEHQQEQHRRREKIDRQND